LEHEEVLELIGSASQRYDTVRAALRYRADGPTLKEIRERIARTESGRRAFGISPREAAERLKCPIDHPEPDGPFGWSCRAWHGDTSEEASQAEAIRATRLPWQARAPTPTAA
jgi:hypothetical protein